MEYIQKNLILMDKLSCYLSSNYNYRIIARYDIKTEFYSVEFCKFTETKKIIFGCKSKDFTKVLSFALAKIQKIIEN